MSRELKNEILQRSNNGLDLYKLFFGGNLNAIDEKRFKNVKNPFYNDKNASFSVYQNEKGMWCFKDYGNTDYSGDIFDFFKFHYKLDIKNDFVMLLNLMVGELNKNQFTISSVKASSITKADSCSKQINSVQLFETDFSDKALKFWNQFGISIDILNLNNVKQITGCRQIYSKDDSDVKNYQYEMTFAYKMVDFAKIYIPKPKRFLYVGKKSPNYIFGQNFSNEKGIVFVVGGEKDVLTMHSLGYEAICFSSETAVPSKEIVKEFYELEVTPVLLYDCDDTGRKCANKISEKFNWAIADLSTILSEDKIGSIIDISDYIKEGQSKEILKEFLDKFTQKEHVLKPEEVKVLEEVEVSKDFNSLESLNEDDMIVKEIKQNYIPILQQVYNNLPELLKQIVEPIREDHKKDLVLTASLTVLSNFINVSGVYGNMTVFPNLYLFITAPASAGKGVLRWVRKLGDSLHNRFVNNYKLELAEYNENGKKGEKPKKESVFVSANASIAALLKQLHNNKGRGIMLETEADSLNDVMKNQWGNLSDVLRRCFEFEMLSSLRIDDDKAFDIENPRLSIVLTGTKNQLFDLIPSAQNGLFSRFLFVEFPLVKKWENMFESAESLDGRYFELSKKVLKYYDQTISENIKFKFTLKQSERFNKCYEQKQNEFDLLLGEDSIASIRRIGNMQFRIAMLLSTIRMLEEGKLQTNFECKDIDFENAEILARWFMNHTKKIYTQLPNKPKYYKELKTIDALLLEKLPNPFSFKDALKVAESLSIPKGTCENMLRRFKKLKITISLAHNLYGKIEI